MQIFKTFRIDQHWPDKNRSGVKYIDHIKLNPKIRGDPNHLSKKFFESIWIEHNLTTKNTMEKQAGNGLSRRHIESSKIANGLQSVSKYSLLQYPENSKVGPIWHTRGDTLRISIHFVSNHQKNEGDEKKMKKNLTMWKKLEGGTLWDFATSILTENFKKIEGAF